MIFVLWWQICEHMGSFFIATPGEGPAIAFAGETPHFSLKHDTDLYR